MDMTLKIRRATEHDHLELGRLLVAAYAALDGFPKPHEAPEYFGKLEHIGDLARQPDTELLVAAEVGGRLLGGVVYFSDMARYGSGGTATQERGAAGFRFLGVDPETRGQGVGRALMEACIRRAQEQGHRQMIIHTTEPMKTAWAMYQRRGFQRSEDLDFHQGQVQVYGFRLRW